MSLQFLILRGKELIRRDFKMFRTEFVRDGDNQIIGNETNFENGDAVVRDQNGRILGRTSDAFRNTRDGNGTLVSRNTHDVGLLFRK